MKIFKRLLSYVFQHRKTLALIFGCTSFVIGFTLVQPLLIKGFLDKALMEKNLVHLQLIIGAFLAITAFKGFFSYSQSYLMNFVGISCVKKIREDLFVKLQHLPISFFETWKSGEIFSRLTNDAGVLTDVMSSSIVYLVNDFIVMLGSVAWMMWKSPGLTLLALIVSPLVAAVLIRFGKWMNHVTILAQTKIAELSQVLFEGVLGIQVVKSFGRERHEIEKFKSKNEEYFAWNMKSVQISATQTPVVEFLAAIGIAVMVYYGGYEVVQGKFTIGDLFAFAGYMFFATNPLYRFSATMTNLQKARAAARRIFEILDSKDEEEKISNPFIPSSVQGKVEFSGIWFRYSGFAKEGEYVLRNVNLVVEPGTMVALVGPSGAGKTSLVDLIPRFYKPTRGVIKLDGIDTSRIPLASLRSYIGIVQQEVMLFAGTIKENIAYGKPNAGEQEIVEAAIAANAHAFIKDLPQGYDTLMEERGLNFSTGQKQRISIARAILRNPKILILDEATSNLDSESEVLIQEALERLMKSKTTFVIAHRLSTIQNADKIVAIEDGQIVEAGSHLELLAKPGLYSRLYHAQVKTVEA